MKVNDEIVLKIEKLSNLGFGIARVDGMVVFVENSCPGDYVKAKITKANKNYCNAVIIEIIEPSQHRVEPFCALQKVCGACQLQFIDYPYQLVCKKQIVEDALKSIAGADLNISDVVPSPQILEYRHKVQYPIAQTKVSRRLLAGYFKPKSHEIVNIKHCPIQPKICDEIIEFIRDAAFEYGISGYNEKKNTGDLRHVVIRCSKATEKNLVILVINAKKSFPKLVDFSNHIFSSFKNISGVCVNYNNKITNVIMGDKSECLAGKDFIKERLFDITFKIGASTFFQVNPSTASNIFSYVKDYIAANFDKPTVLDVYSGVSTFGITIADVSKKVVCVESCSEAVGLADEVIKQNEISNVELHNMDAEFFFKKELETKKRKFNITILDPPRKGCSEKSLEYILQLTKDTIIYVSCNPATLARDLKFLMSKGAKIISVQPFDMFCHTYHVENVAIIDLKDVNKL